MILNQNMKNIYLVPHGSILGPLLFLMFINELPLYTENVFTDLNADDTTIYNQINNSQHCIEQNLQATLQMLSLWCKHSGMLFVDHLCYLCFVKRRSQQDQPSVPLIF